MLNKKLSTLIEVEFQEKYPSLVEKKPYVGRLRRFVQRYKILILSCLIFVVVVISNEALLSSGITLSNYRVTNVSAASILSTFIQYIAGLLGIVIPVLLLIVQFVVNDKQASSVTNIYMDNTGIKRTTIFVLATLALQTVLMVEIQVELMTQPKTIFYSILFVTFFSLALIVEIGLLIQRVRNSFDSDFLLAALLQKINVELKTVFAHEAKNRIGKIVYVETLKKYQFSTSPNSIDINRVQPIYSTKTGYVIDIQLAILNRLSSKLFERSEPIFTLITVKLSDRIAAGETIGYIALETNYEWVQHELDKAFIVQSDVPSTQGFVQLLEQLKEMARKAILDENSSQFEQIFGHYGEILTFVYTNPLPSVNDVTDWIIGWGGERLISHDIHELIEVAAKHPNDRFSHIIAHEIHNSAVQCFYTYTGDNESNLLGLLDYYRFVYQESFKAGNAHKTDYFYRYVTGDYSSLLDYHWNKQVTQNLAAPTRMEQCHKLFMLIYRFLEKLLAETVQNRDWNTLGSLLNTMQPKEILAGWDVTMSHGGAYEIESKLINSDLHQSELVGMKNALDIAKRIPAEIEREHQILALFVLSIAFEQYDQNELPLADLVHVNKMVYPYCLSWEKQIQFITDSNKESHALARLFSSSPNTKQVYSVDYYRKVKLFHVISGIQDINNLSPLAQSRYPVYELINELLSWQQYIENSISKWTIFLELDEAKIIENSRKLTDLYHTISNNYLLHELKHTASANLTTGRISIIRNAFLESIEKSTALQVLLNKSGTYYQASELPNGQRIKQTLHVPRKMLFGSEKVDSTKKEPLFQSNMGSLLQTQIDLFLAHQLLRLAPEGKPDVSWTSLEQYLDAGFSILAQHEQKPNCILIPTVSPLVFYLRETEEFIETKNITFPQGQVGYVREEIPIIQYRCTFEKHPYLLFVNLDNALTIRFSDIQVDIQDVTEANKRHLLQTAEYNKELEELLQTQIIMSQVLEILDENPSACVKIEILLPELRIL